MNVRGYEYKISEDFLDYEFDSIGPKGKIKKIVRFTPRNADGVTYFNLGFGDWNNNENQIDDHSTSNNQDKEKVLATVALIVLEFTAYFPDVWIYAQGSTGSRTRLYQMGIVANWNSIEPLLFVYGYYCGEWHTFQKNVNYEAFLVLPK